MQLFSEFCNEFIELRRNVHNRRSVRIENLWRAELEKNSRASEIDSLERKMKSLLVVWCLLAIVSNKITTSVPPLPNIINFLERGGESLRRELPDQTDLRSEYDFIIVGAGSAGCVVANRLSENPNWNVLLIEAGQHENLLMDVPMLVHFLQGYSVNWAYKTEPSKNYCLGMNNNQW